MTDNVTFFSTLFAHSQQVRLEIGLQTKLEIVLGQSLIPAYGSIGSHP
jgi:hypothetical protein